MSNGASYVRGSFPHVCTSLISDLEKDVTSQEVYDSLFDMAPLKALGVDGLHAQFYQSQWSI